jgi:hypothetical protein
LPAVVLLFGTVSGDDRGAGAAVVAEAGCFTAAAGLAAFGLPVESELVSKAAASSS